MTAGMLANRPRPEDEKLQRERFQETVKDLDVEDGREAFRKVVPSAKIAKPRPKKRP